MVYKRRITAPAPLVEPLLGGILEPDRFGQIGREISGVFLSMALGLATGMGYVGLAVVAFVILAAALALLTAVNFGQRSESERVLKITIPESLDYDGLFDDLFDQYTRSHTLERVKTANMGTLYELEYRVTLPGE